MLHIRISSPTEKLVTGFECGTRALFDELHESDPLWVFVDRPNAVHRSDLPGFLKKPRDYYIDVNGNLRLIPT